MILGCLLLSAEMVKVHIILKLLLCHILCIINMWHLNCVYIYNMDMQNYVVDLFFSLDSRWLMRLQLLPPLVEVCLLV